MPQSLSVTFLGTSAGSGPTWRRMCSALSLNLDSASWLVDCAESTQFQIMKAKSLPGRMRGRVDKIFVTHLHVDHCSGIVPFMSNAMSSFRRPAETDFAHRLDLYGPSGLRKLIRTNLQIMQTVLKGKYAAHELLFPGDPTTTCDPEEMHPNESPGRDIRQGDDGFWRDFEEAENIKVDAAPIVHRIPCLGYVFKENPQMRFSPENIPDLAAIPTELLPEGLEDHKYLLAALKNSHHVTLKDGTVLKSPQQEMPGRKIVILGDTSDPSAIAPIAMDASLLVHEATNAWLPSELNNRRETDPRVVRASAISRGHSTPDMAGKFAYEIGADQLVLNHFGARFASRPRSDFKSRTTRQQYDDAVISEIESQASRAWKLGNAVAAYDLLTVEVPSDYDPSLELHNISNSDMKDAQSMFSESNGLLK